MENILIYHVDAFTNQPFSGNPAVVCVTEKPLSEELMAKIANEMNLSETAFIHQLTENMYGIRWFTPTTEVRLCGHATLAATHILYEQNYVTGDQVNFQTKNKDMVLSAWKSCYGITLDFPSDRLSEWKSPAQQALLSYLGLPHNCPVYYGAHTTQILVEAPNEDSVRSLDPNYSRLKGLEGTYAGVTVTARSKKYDFISRFFDPWEGIDEDPVTGSAHTLLAPYWAPKLNKYTLKARQESKRGGELVLELKDERVLISGEAITIFGGKLNINI